MKVLTGDAQGTWDEFITGKKVSPLMYQAGYVFCTLLYVVTELVVLRAPRLFPLFWSVIYGGLFLARVESFRKTAQEYFLLDFCYMAAMMACLATVVLPTNAALWKIAFTLVTGFPLMATILLGSSNAITIASSSSVSHACSVFLHFMPSVVMLVDLNNKRETNPQLYHQLNPNFLPTSMILKQHFIAPMVVFTLWQAFYLLATEVLSHSKLYPRHDYLKKKYVKTQNKAPEPSERLPTNYRTMLKYTFRYNHAQANLKVPRAWLIDACKTVGLLHQKEKFKPERVPKHHYLVLFSYTVFQFVQFSAMLPVSYLLLKHQALFLAVLVILFLVLVMNGAKTVYPIWRKKSVQPPQNLVPDSEDEKKSATTWAESDEEELDEGGDEVGDTWKAHLKKKQSGSKTDHNGLSPQLGSTAEKEVKGQEKKKEEEEEVKVDDAKADKEEEEMDKNPPPMPVKPTFVTSAGAADAKQEGTTEEVPVGRLDSIDGHL